MKPKMPGDVNEPSEIVRPEIKMTKERRVTEKGRPMTLQHERETYQAALKQLEIKREKARQRAIEREAVFLQAEFEMAKELRMTTKRHEANRQMTLDELKTWR